MLLKTIISHHFRFIFHNLYDYTFRFIFDHFSNLRLDHCYRRHEFWSICSTCFLNWDVTGFHREWNSQADLWWECAVGMSWGWKIRELNRGSVGKSSITGLDTFLELKTQGLTPRTDQTCSMIGLCPIKMGWSSLIKVGLNIPSIFGNPMMLGWSLIF